jgi:hypothetical protein
MLNIYGTDPTVTAKQERKIMICNDAKIVYYVSGLQRGFIKV